MVGRRRRANSDVVVGGAGVVGESDCSPLVDGASERRVLLVRTVVALELLLGVVGCEFPPTDGRRRLGRNCGGTWDGPSVNGGVKEQKVERARNNVGKKT